MVLTEALKRSSSWMAGSGPAADIVISSRIRLARNLKEYPFPGQLTTRQAEEIQEKIKGVFKGRLAAFDMKEATPLEREALVEKHLVSPDFAAQEEIGTLLLSDDERISVMVNEEDHLRIQCLLPGLQLEEARREADEIDDAVEASLDYAFSDKYGYLTSCPTNVGTGMRASLMLHLPAMVITRQAQKVLPSLGKVGLVVRGIYGEGTEALGNLFQISNQVTLGQTEEDIIGNLLAIGRQIIDQERAARESLKTYRRWELEDLVGRAYGTLKHARVISSEETLQLVSKVRLGIDLGIIADLKPRVFNDLIVKTRPGYLQIIEGRSLNPQERDLKRAELIRRELE